jgi:hypothetical protein
LYPSVFSFFAMRACPFSRLSFLSRSFPTLTRLLIYYLCLSHSPPLKNNKI